MYRNRINIMFGPNSLLSSTLLSGYAHSAALGLALSGSTYGSTDPKFHMTAAPGYPTANPYFYQVPENTSLSKELQAKKWIYISSSARHFSFSNSNKNDDTILYA